MLLYYYNYNISIIIITYYIKYKYYNTTYTQCNYYYNTELL